MLQEFKKFLMRGNVLDLAVAVIVGGAFGKITTSLVNDVLMPPLGLILGKADFSALYLNMGGQHYASLSEAEKAGAPIIRYGLFLNNIINFLIVAFAIFIVVKAATKVTSLVPKRAAEAKMKDCPFCISSVPVKATRCPNCTSHLEEAPAK